LVHGDCVPADISDHPAPTACPLEARVSLTLDGVIAGTVAIGRAKPVPFHGWLELMDALEGARARGARESRPAA
jgi:hypothetical protein